MAGPPPALLTWRRPGTGRALAFAPHLHTPRSKPQGGAAWRGVVASGCGGSQGSSRHGTGNSPGSLPGRITAGSRHRTQRGSAFPTRTQLEGAVRLHEAQIQRRQSPGSHIPPAPPSEVQRGGITGQFFSIVVFLNIVLNVFQTDKAARAARYSGSTFVQSLPCHTHASAFVQGAAWWVAMTRTFSVQSP